MPQSRPGGGVRGSPEPRPSGPAPSQDSPSSHRHQCACHSRPGSRLGSAWGRRSTHRHPVAHSGGRPGSPGAESLCGAGLSKPASSTHHVPHCSITSSFLIWTVGALTTPCRDREGPAGGVCAGSVLAAQAELGWGASSPCTPLPGWGPKYGRKEVSRLALTVGAAPGPGSLGRCSLQVGLDARPAQPAVPLQGIQDVTDRGRQLSHVALAFREEL